MPLIAEILGNRRPRHRSLDANKRGLVGGRDNDDRAFQSLLAEVTLNKVTHLTSALPDKGDDTNIRLSVACDHGEQRGLANARPRHDADTLPIAECDEPVDCTHTDVEIVVDARARERRRRRCLQGILFLCENWAFAVDRIAEPVKNTPEQFRANLDTQTPPRCNDLTAGTDALHFTDGHEENTPLTKAHDLRRNRRHPRKMRTHIAEFPDRDGRSLRLNDEPNDLRHFARQLHWCRIVKRIAEFLDIYGKWGIPPRFTHIHSITSRTAFLSCSICVCKRASTLPFGVSTRQSPGFSPSSEVIVRFVSPAVRAERSSSRAISTKS